MLIRIAKVPPCLQRWLVMIEVARNYTFSSKGRRLNYLHSESEGEKHTVCKILFSCLLGKALKENVQSSEEIF